jgi:hypothetical protein
MCLTTADGRQTIVSYLLSQLNEEHNSKLDAFGHTPTHLALIRGHPECASLLMKCQEEGADILGVQHPGVHFSDVAALYSPQDAPASSTNFDIEVTAAMTSNTQSWPEPPPPPENSRRQSDADSMLLTDIVSDLYTS